MKKQEIKDIFDQIRYTYPEAWKYKITHLNSNGHQEKAYRKANHRYEKRQSRYSTAGNLLAMRRFLRKSSKKRFKEILKVLPAPVVPFLLEPPHLYHAFHIYSLKDHTPHIAIDMKMFGSFANNVTSIGSLEIGTKINLSKNEEWLKNLKFPIIANPKND